ncbi:MAG: NAD(P)H-dependent oxidoreductase [Planctomycetota bacterium]|nr:NAD(P)H-dependent oxidoreductase [Planctomycetota bacterium]
MAKILVLYHSQEYGHTKLMADAVAAGAKAAGADVTAVNTNDARLDVETYRQMDAAVFGSPDYYSYIAGGLKMFLDDWYIAKNIDGTGLADKHYGLFYSHGGGGKVGAVMQKLFGMLGKQVGQAVESNGKPTEQVLEACKALGRDVARAAARF